MTIEEFRAEVQKCLKNERRVTDVAFEPLPDGLEKVYFWDTGIRASFLSAPAKLDNKQTLALTVKAQAQTAYEAALENAVKAAEQAAAEAAALATQPADEAA